MTRTEALQKAEEALADADASSYAEVKEALSAVAAVYIQLAQELGASQPPPPARPSDPFNRGWIIGGRGGAGEVDRGDRDSA